MIDQMAKKSISTQLTPENIVACLAILAEIPNQLYTLSIPLSPEQLRTPLAADERSFTENLAHLINCEERAAEAIYLALLLDEPLIAPIHAERDWGQLFYRQQYPFADLLAYFRFRRMVLLSVLRPLTPEQWERTIREESKQRKESVYWRVRGLALHEAEHLADLKNKLAASNTTS